MNRGLGGAGLDVELNPSTQIPAEAKAFSTYDGEFNYYIANRWQFSNDVPRAEAIAHVNEARRRAVVCRLDGRHNETEAWKRVAEYIKNLHGISDHETHSATTDDAGPSSASDKV